MPPYIDTRIVMTTFDPFPWQNDNVTTATLSTYPKPPKQKKREGKESTRAMLGQLNLTNPRRKKAKPQRANTYRKPSKETEESFVSLPEIIQSTPRSEPKIKLRRRYTFPGGERNKHSDLEVLRKKQNEGLLLPEIAIEQLPPRSQLLQRNKHLQVSLMQMQKKLGDDPFLASTCSELRSLTQALAVLTKSPRQREVRTVLQLAKKQLALCQPDQFHIAVEVKGLIALLSNTAHVEKLLTANPALKDAYGRFLVNQKRPRTPAMTTLQEKAETFVDAQRVLMRSRSNEARNIFESLRSDIGLAQTSAELRNAFLQACISAEKQGQIPLASTCFAFLSDNLLLPLRDVSPYNVNGIANFMGQKERLTLLEKTLDTAIDKLFEERHFTRANSSLSSGLRGRS